MPGRPRAIRWKARRNRGKARKGKELRVKQTGPSENAWPFALCAWLLRLRYGLWISKRRQGRDDSSRRDAQRRTRRVAHHALDLRTQGRRTAKQRSVHRCADDDQVGIDVGGEPDNLGIGATLSDVSCHSPVAFAGKGLHSILYLRAH